MYKMYLELNKHEYLNYYEHTIYLHIEKKFYFKKKTDNTATAFRTNSKLDLYKIHIQIFITVHSNLRIP